MEKLFSLEEVAEVLGVHKRYVQDLVYSQKLGHVQIGRKVRVSETSLTGFIESRTILARDGVA